MCAQYVEDTNVMYLLSWQYYTGHERRVQSTVEELVRQANSARKQILEELRTGRLGSELINSSNSPAGVEFKGAVEAAFLLRLNMDTEAPW